VRVETKIKEETNEFQWQYRLKTWSWEKMFLHVLLAGQVEHWEQVVQEEEEEKEEEEGERHCLGTELSWL